MIQVVDLFGEPPPRRYQFDTKRREAFVYERAEAELIEQLQGAASSDLKLKRALHSFQSGHISDEDLAALRATARRYEQDARDAGWVPIDRALLRHHYLPAGWSLEPAYWADEVRQAGWVLASRGPGLIIPSLLRSDQEVVDAVVALLEGAPLSTGGDGGSGPRRRMKIRSRTSNFMLEVDTGGNIYPGPTVTELDIEATLQAMPMLSEDDAKVIHDRWADRSITTLLCLRPVGRWDEHIPDFVEEAAAIDEIRESTHFDTMVSAFDRAEICAYKVRDKLGDWAANRLKQINNAELAAKMAAFLSEEGVVTNDHGGTRRTKNLCDMLRDQAISLILEEQEMMDQLINQALNYRSPVVERLIKAGQTHFANSREAAEEALEWYPELRCLGPVALAWYWRQYRHEVDGQLSVVDDHRHINRYKRDPGFIIYLAMLALQEAPGQLYHHDSFYQVMGGWLTRKEWLVVLADLIATLWSDNQVSVHEAADLLLDAERNMAILIKSIETADNAAIALMAREDGPVVGSAEDANYCELLSRPFSQSL